MTDSSFSQRLKQTWNSHAFLPSLSRAAASENSQFSPATSEGWGWGRLAGWFGLSRMANSAQIADTSPASFLLSRKALENHCCRRRAVASAARRAPGAASATIHYGRILKFFFQKLLDLFFHSKYVKYGSISQKTIILSVGEFWKLVFGWKRIMDVSLKFAD